MMNLERFRPPVVRRTIAKDIAAALREAIIALDVKPGDTISESEIAQRFGVSRQPVREAFIQLADQGLLRIRPQRSTEVVRISVRDVFNAVFVRSALEVALARRAAEAGPQLPPAHFDTMLAEQAEASRREDFRRFQALDDAFHREIANLAGKDHVWRLIDNQKAQMDRVRFMSLSLGTPATVEEHRRIAAAILAGDADLAAETIREHLHKIETKVWELRERNLSHFDPDEKPGEISL